jgi:hypothetical protein
MQVKELECATFDAYHSCSHRCLYNPANTNSQEHLFVQVFEQQNEGCEQWRQHATIRTLGQGHLNAMTED